MEPLVIEYGLADDPPKSTLYYGRNVIESLQALDEGSVQTVVTSPPYWNLRDYGTPPVTWPDGWVGQLGLEPTPDEYVQHLVQVFREVRRVLRDDGTVWMNLGDSYMSNPAKDTAHMGGFTGDRLRADREGYGSAMVVGKPKVPGLKYKDLVGIPWRVALALQADGWYLRNAIIWHKKNHMPHPVKDRMVCAYEFIFLFSKQDRYFFDLDAVRVPHTSGTYDDEGNFEPSQNWFEEGEGGRKMDQTEGQLGTMAGPPRRLGRGLFNPTGKNPGDVWDFPTQPFPGAHFAVWPESIPDRCIRAGTSEKGRCPACGTPWRRKVLVGEPETVRMGTDSRKEGVAANKSSRAGCGVRPRTTEGWEQGCSCPAHEPVRCVVMDIFSGSGTTGAVAMKLGRDYIGLDLNESYLDMASQRIQGEKVRRDKGDDEPDLIREMFFEGE